MFVVSFTFLSDGLNSFSITSESGLFKIPEDFEGCLKRICQRCLLTYYLLIIKLNVQYVQSL